MLNASVTQARCFGANSQLHLDLLTICAGRACTGSAGVCRKSDVSSTHLGSASQVPTWETHLKLLFIDSYV